MVEIIAGGLRGGKRLRLADVGHKPNAAGRPRRHESMGLQICHSGVLLGEAPCQWKGCGQSWKMDYGRNGSLSIGEKREAPALCAEHQADCPGGPWKTFCEAYGSEESD